MNKVRKNKFCMFGGGGILLILFPNGGHCPPPRPVPSTTAYSYSDFISIDDCGQTLLRELAVIVIVSLVSC
jgi:hypothetical protein